MQIVFQDEETFRKAFRARLRATRKEMGKLSQKAMAAKLGIPFETYAKLETRDNFPLYLLPTLILQTEKPYSYWCLGIEPALEKRGNLRVVE